MLHREHDGLHVAPEAVDDRAEDQRVGIVAREGPAAIDRQVEFVAAEFALHREQFVGQYAPFAVFADLRADEFGDVADRFRQAGCEQVVAAFADVQRSVRASLAQREKEGLAMRCYRRSCCHLRPAWRA